MNRRGFLGSILALAAAPAIVRADSLMRVVPTDTRILTSAVELGDVIQITGVEDLYCQFVVTGEVGGNFLLTASHVTREALRILHETTAMMSNVNRDWEATKVGASKTIRIRRPQIYRPPILTA